MPQGVWDVRQVFADEGRPYLLDERGIDHRRLFMYRNPRASWVVLRVTLQKL
jgi:hypothetical protein